MAQTRSTASMTDSAADVPAPASGLSLWLPVIVSGTVLTVWLGVLLWIAMRG